MAGKLAPHHQTRRGLDDADGMSTGSTGPMAEDPWPQGGGSGLMDRRVERGVLDQFVAAVRAALR